MPSSNQYDPKELAYVKPFSSSSILYGFMTNANAATRTACGVVTVAGATPANLVIGANAPKPGRASKFVTDEYNSCFYNFDKYNALRADGWRLSKPRIRLGASSANSKAVFVTIGSIKYAWKMPTSLYTKISANLAALGIEDASSGDKDLVWGVSSPKPPRVSMAVAGASGIDILSTFCDPSKLDSLPAGWGSAAGGYVDPTT